jgi:Secretion system C-terminal sorting domain/Bacterial Ig domain
MNIPMRISNRAAIILAWVILPMCLWAQVVAKDDFDAAARNAYQTTIKVLDNDFVANGRSLRIVDLPLVNHGKASIATGGKAIVFTPDEDFTGVALVNYTITDDAGYYDMGLLTIDVFETPTPTSGSIHLFVRRGDTLTFTVPKGFRPGTTNAGTLMAVVPFQVYRFAPSANAQGTVVELICNKEEGGIIKDYRVNINVLAKNTRAKYLRDDYFNAPIGQLKIIDVVKNDALPFTPLSISFEGSGYGLISAESNPLSTTKPTFQPDPNYAGITSVNYTITFQNGYQETATAYITVSDYLPAKDEYVLNALANTASQVLRYAVPEDFKEYYRFETINNGNTLRGGSVFFDGAAGGSRNLIYNAPTNSGFTTDQFDVIYWVGNVSKRITIRLNLLDNPTGQACNDCVWPGDANRDGFVDMWDVFPIGTNLGQYGNKRPSVATDWQPYAADNWTTRIDGNLNAKHADLNGDGLVSAADTNVILKNFGKANAIFPQKNVTQTQVEAFLVSGASSVQPGDAIEILVMVGNAEFPAIDARGFTFKVSYDRDMIKESSVYFDFGKFNWLSNYDSYLTLSKITSLGRIEASIARSRDRGASGHGQLGKVHAVVLDDVAGVQLQSKPQITFKIEGTMVDKAGHLHAMKPKTVTLDLRLKKDDKPMSDKDLAIFPNPTSDMVTFYLSNTNTINSIELFNLSGRSVAQYKNVNDYQKTVDLTGFATGMYFAKVQTEKGVITKKINVQ